MIALPICLLFAFRIINAENVVTKIHHKHPSTYPDLLNEAFKSQQWAADDQPCLDTMVDILDNAKNFTLWAVWILDSLQQPVGHLYGQTYHLGSYDECLRPHRGFKTHPQVPKTHYCVTHVALVKTEEQLKPNKYRLLDHNATTEIYLKRPNKHGRVFSNMTIGLCVPTVCHPSAVAKIARSMLQVSLYGPLSGSADVQVSHCLQETVEESTGPAVFKFVCALLAFTTIFCTFYVKNGYVTPGSLVDELARCFCLVRNTESLTKVRDEEVFSMNFFRVVSCFVVVAMHYWIILYSFFPSNALDFDNFIEENGHLITHSEVLVDTFLALSGLLFTRGIFNDRWENPLKFIWKRYIRLSAALMALVFFVVTISGETSSGPAWGRIVVEQKVCQDNWWVSMLMLANVLSVDRLCVPTTWYVPCDFQLCVYATIFFVIYKKNTIFGWLALATFFVFSNVAPGVVTYINNYSALVFYGPLSITDVGNNSAMVYVYFKSWHRGGPFVVGMVMGYIMYTYKPKDYRNVIGKFTSYASVITSVVIMYLIIVIGFHYYLEDDPINAAIFVALNRTVWGIAVCVVIAVSEYGVIPFLNRMYSWDPLVPLSRLTYGVYLTHFVVMQLSTFSLRTNYDCNIFTLTLGCLGVVVFSVAMSLVIWLLVEAPIININNVFLDKTWKFKTEKPVQQINGATKKEL